ncbi:hypothetical protein Cni_G03843 [Canna indica]|uniref:PsbP C-terminal domain-containing protein n=1 Tax=Canna indica TaxID=4628 RepID=A0AAQ3JSE0_9LILI|nr:hypothetical protein Cni_G03843 [Canna indica]
MASILSSYIFSQLGSQEDTLALPSVGFKEYIDTFDGYTFHYPRSWIQVNIKSYASNNELAVMPQDRVQQLEWDRHYLSVLGVENNRLYELRLQSPENVFLKEENDLREVMDSFRVVKSVN